VWAAWAGSAVERDVNEGVVLAIDVDRSRIERRVETRYCDMVTEDLDEALRLCEAAVREGRALSVGWWATAATYCRRLCGAESRWTW